MSGSERNNEEGEGGGGGDGGAWAALWKVASAAAVVAGGVYSVIKQMEAKQNQVEIGVGGSGGWQTREIGVWKKPKVGWLKLNVDGSLLREIQSAGCGGVLRNDSGNWIYGFAQKLSPSSREDETEKEGILRGLKWAKEKGFMRVEVESDNQGIVETANSWRRSTDPLILAIRELLRSPDWQTTLTWIPGAANGVADKLADIGRNLTSFDLHEYDYPPASCRTALNND